MSADRWSICPKCTERREQKIAKLHSDVEDSYGKVTIEEWDNLRARVRKLEDSDKEDTLCEDFDTRINEEWIFSVSYKAGCSECGFTYAFSTEIDTRESL